MATWPDLTAFSLLYDRYDRPVYAMAAHLLDSAEADEVVQEVSLCLWRSAAQFESARPLRTLVAGHCPP